MSTCAVVPLKCPEHAKSRLAAVLSASQRRVLQFALAERVIAALRDTPAIAEVAVVTASDGLARFSSSLGATVMRQTKDAGTAEAFAFAVSELRLRQCDVVLMIAGDLPLISSGAVQQILDAAPSRGIVVVPDARGTGTNALLCVPPHIIAPAFGGDSLQRHLAAACAIGVPARRLDIEALALDLDEPEDLEVLMRSGPPHMRSVLGALGIRRTPKVA